MDIEKLIAEITDEIYNKVSSDVNQTSETCSSPAVNLAKYIDHTLLKAEASEQQIVKLCAEARENQFASVCVNPGYVPLASKELAGSGVKTCCVIGFPLGATTIPLRGIY